MAKDRYENVTVCDFGATELIAIPISCTEILHPHAMISIKAFNGMVHGVPIQA
jgi:hypothetical protein